MAFPAAPPTGAGRRAESADGRGVASVIEDGDIEIQEAGASAARVLPGRDRRGRKRDYEVQIWNVEALRSFGAVTR